MDELALRFLFGGAAVALSYVISVLAPWKELGGIFAAFPAVMAVAVMMTGRKDGSKTAAQIAEGAVYGMLGCAVCVFSTFTMMRVFHTWWPSIGVGLLCWYLSAILVFKLVERLRTSLDQSGRRRAQ
jgi:membrane associated rhomboid family serine protease